MKILEYESRGGEEYPWSFSKVEFRKINLLVGDTATGKTRLLNTIFNLGSFAASATYRNGFWDVTFEHEGITYRWVLETDMQVNEEDSKIIRESLWKFDGEKESLLVDRDTKSFTFNDKDMPKLSLRETSISLLKEEEPMAPIHEAFSTIMRRRFFHDALSKISELQPIPPKLLDNISAKRELRTLFGANMNLSANLFILERHFSDVYGAIRATYREVFPLIREVAVRDLTQISKKIAIPGRVPVFCIREGKSRRWIPITELSSGMQKVLLILTDVFMMPEGGIYMIDEYENSLGINAIDFLPEFLMEFEKDVQFLITSHHPYIINQIPPKDWYIFHRRGNEVFIKYGDELAERFGKSKQKAFIQLINDPFYAEGVE